MPARKCLKCGDSYPYRQDSSKKCPVCGDALQYSSHAVPDAEWPPEIKEVLPQLDPESEFEILRDWNALRAEARRRGPRWSEADIFAEGWLPSDRAA